MISTISEQVKQIGQLLRVKFDGPFSDGQQWDAKRAINFTGTSLMMFALYSACALKMAGFIEVRSEDDTVKLTKDEWDVHISTTNDNVGFLLVHHH